VESQRGLPETVCLGQANAAGDVVDGQTIAIPLRFTMTARRTGWLVLGALVALTAVVVLQETKHAMLPRSQTNLLWGAEVVSIVAGLVLRSGAMRDNRWREEQRRLGTIANNYYEPRRGHLTQGFAIGFGVFGGLWWAIATWSVVFTGMRRGTETRGLDSFEVAALCGAVTGALIGGAVGLAIGHVWETWHRRAREEKLKVHV
jgi:hypothetical protein